MNGLNRTPAMRLALSACAAVVGSLAIAAGAMADTPSPGGAFVIGDQDAAIGSTVTFWGAQWHKDNALSGGGAPASFKGFADTATATPASCGQPWTTRPGNSSAPPPAVDLQPATDGLSLVPMVVSSQITKSGPVISGDTAKVVLVQVDPGYEPNPGHAGTGTVVGIVCGGDISPV
jgi:hypothetical protein